VTQIKEAYFKSLWFEVSIMIKCVGRVTDQNVIWLGILVTSLNIRMNNSSDIVLANTTSNQFWEHTHTHTHTHKRTITSSSIFSRSVPISKNSLKRLKLSVLIRP